MCAFIIVIGISLALLGVYQLLILIVRRTKLIPYEKAESIINERIICFMRWLAKTIKKFIDKIASIIKTVAEWISTYNKQQFDLYCSDFPGLFANEISYILSEGEFTQWARLFKSRTRAMEISNYNSGLPFYAVKLYTPNDIIKQQYEQIIYALAGNILSNSHCCPDVMIDWKNPEGAFTWCEIRYARTAEETAIIRNYIRSNDERISGSGNDTVLDDTLNEAIERKMNGH